LGVYAHFSLREKIIGLKERFYVWERVEVLVIQCSCGFKALQKRNFNYSEIFCFNHYFLSFSQIIAISGNIIMGI